MIIKTLVENTSCDPALAAEHGLSLYIETDKHKILFDTGASDLFAINAVQLGIDLAAIDIVIISHGHSDHGGGLGKFLEINQQAKIYFNSKAFAPHFAKIPNSQKVFIGLDEELLPNSRFIFVDQELVIDDELELFSGVRGDKYLPMGNHTLFMQGQKDIVQDDFVHEQNLIIHQDDKKVLVAGCAHRGIVNIVEHCQQRIGVIPDFVIGGFHLYNRGTDESEDPSIIKKVADFLIASSAKYYTLHCTGETAYAQLKELMGDAIDYLATGKQISL